MIQPPMPQYPWNAQFRERILAICLDPGWYAQFGSAIILPEYFESDGERKVATSISEFYTAYKRPPASDELRALHYQNGTLELAERVVEATGQDLTFAKDQALEFAQQQAIKLAVLACVEDIKKNDLTRLRGRIDQALLVGTDVLNVGLDLKKDIAKWVVAEANDEKIPTGILHLDLELEGGLGRGELGVIIAGTNVGKTYTLVNMGIGAAGLLSKRNVVHVTCELKATKVAKRYGARLVFRWLERDGCGIDQYQADFEQAVAERLPGNVYIREWPSKTARIADIEGYLNRLKMLGVEFDLLIVDYPEEMKLGKGEEYRHVLADTFRELRRLAGQFDIAVWSAMQTRREALNKELVTLEDIAESYEIAHVGDVVVAVCQTREEKEQEQARLFGAKVRDGGGGWIIECHTSEQAHALVSERVMTVTELIEARKAKKRGEE